MTIKIEATHHDLVKIKNLTMAVDTVLDGGDCPSWRDVMYEVQEMLTEAELCEAEPLIKDEKIRKAVRAWAEANKMAEAWFVPIKDADGAYLYWELESIAWGQPMTICFSGEPPDALEDLGTYTIEKLCGSSSDEEEE